jgi:hypothetical protein
MRWSELLLHLHLAPPPLALEYQYQPRFELTLTPSSTEIVSPTRDIGTKLRSFDTWFDRNQHSPDTGAHSNTLCGIYHPHHSNSALFLPTLPTKMAPLRIGFVPGKRSANASFPS